MRNKNVLVLAPHTDDGELGCGGTINRLLEENYTVYYAAFSICEESVPEGFPKNTLEIEVKNATHVLGITPENLFIYNYPVRKFNSFRQAILEDLVKLRHQLNPQIVFMPCSASLHQDHKTIYEEGMRAFKHFTCYGYDLPWDTITFSSTSFFKLEKKHLDKKWNALQEYKTQNFRSYVDNDFIFGLARVRGAQIAELYAESFELLRLIN